MPQDHPKKPSSTSEPPLYPKMPQIHPKMPFSFPEPPRNHHFFPKFTHLCPCLAQFPHPNKPPCPIFPSQAPHVPLITPITSVLPQIYHPTPTFPLTPHPFICFTPKPPKFPFILQSLTQTPHIYLNCPQFISVPPKFTSTSPQNSHTYPRTPTTISALLIPPHSPKSTSLLPQNAHIYPKIPITTLHPQTYLSFT